MGDVSTKVEPRPGEIVCNIGDLLMSWSDDASRARFIGSRRPVILGRLRWPPLLDRLLQSALRGCRDSRAVEEVPDLVTGKEFTDTAMRKNFAALKALKAKEALESSKNECE